MSSDSDCQVSVSGWQRLTYIGDAAQYQDVQKVVDDPSENWSDYYRDDVLPKAALPSTLTLIWIAIMLTYLIWRLVLIIERCCCGIRRQQQSNYDKCANILTGKASFFSKMVLSIFGLCAFGWYVYGIALLASEPNVVSNGFDVVDSLNGQLGEVVIKSYALQSSVQSIPKQLEAINQTVANRLDASTLDEYTQCVGNGVERLSDLLAIESNLSSLGQTLDERIQPALNELNQQIPELRSSVSPLMTPLLTEERRNANNAAFQTMETALAALQMAMQNITDNSLDDGRAQELQLRLDEVLRAQNQLQQQEQALDELDQIISTYASTIQSLLNNLQVLFNTALPLEAVGAQYNESMDVGKTVVACIDGLITNLQTVNDSIISLPADVQQVLQTINQWRQQLDILTAPNQLSSQLNSLTRSLSGYSNNVNMQLFSTNVSEMRSNLQELQEDLQQQSSAFASNSVLQTVLAQYLLFPSTQRYQQLQGVVQLNYGVLNETQTRVKGWQSDVDSIYTELTTFNNMVNGQIIDFQQLQQELPSDSEFQQLLSSLQNISALQGDTFSADLQQISTLSAQINEQVNEAVSNLLGEVNIIVNGVSQTINSSMSTLQVDVIDRISDFTQDHRSDAEQIFDSIQIIGIYILFPVIILLIVTVIIFAISNFTFGIEVSLFSIIFVSLVIVIFGLIAATVSVVDNDVCAHADVLIVHEVEQEWGVNNVIPAFVRHVLYGNEGGIESILRRYFNYNNDQIMAQINLLDSKVKSALNSLGSTPGQQVDEILNVIQKFPSKIDIILGLLSYTQLNVYYVQLEDVSCCQLREFVTSYNQIVGLAGFLTIPIIISLFVWLHWLRKLPPSRVGCGICYCRNAAEFKLDLPPYHIS